ncbi:MAG: hypothetical protein N2246_05280 [Candidatus Sumerlaeia bacterium]|nr:hypothetical protein [Candidatus Sumerlaeia bacterium]
MSRFFYRSLILLCLCNSVWALYYEALTLEDLARKADVILIGKCVDKQSEFVAGHIETRVKIQTSEYLKGKLAAEFTLTLLGGELSSPVPLGQYVEGMPQFYKGEEVLLFLGTKQIAEQQKKVNDLLLRPDLPENYKQSLSRSTLPNSPTVIGLWQGKWTILTDKLTGEKRVSRFRMEDLGFVHNDLVAQKIYALMTAARDETPERAAEIKQQVEQIISEQQSATKEAVNETTVKSPDITAKKDDEVYIATLKPEPGAPGKLVPQIMKMDRKNLKTVKDLKKTGESKKEQETTENEGFQNVITALPKFTSLQTLEEVKEQIREALTKK